MELKSYGYDKEYPDLEIKYENGKFVGNLDNKVQNPLIQVGERTLSSKDSKHWYNMARDQHRLVYIREDENHMTYATDDYI